MVEETNDGKDNTQQTLSEQDKIKQQYEELKATNDAMEAEMLRGQKLKAEASLAGTTGGNIEPTMLSPEDKKKEAAKEYFKGTALGDVINKANE